jgi:hypothetical protein
VSNGVHVAHVAQEERILGFAFGQSLDIQIVHLGGGELARLEHRRQGIQAGIGDLRDPQVWLHLAG